MTKRCALLGSPAAHSLSPVLHTAAYRSLGIHKEYSYVLQDVDAAALPGVLAQLDGSWAGLSLTLPLKQAVIPLLDLLAPTARVTHAVNTLLVAPGGPHVFGDELDAGPIAPGRPGLLVGANTDVHGIAAALSERLGGRRPRRGVIVGARATASSALVAMDRLGMEHVTVVARAIDGPGRVLEVAKRLGRTLEHVTFDEHAAIGRALKDADVVVSSVPRGVADQLVARLRGLDLEGRVLLDAVYDPRPTPVAAAWRDRGGAIAPGWAMLLHQAWLQVKLMTGGLEADVAAMRDALLAEMERRRAGGQPATFAPPFAAA